MELTGGLERLRRLDPAALGRAREKLFALLKRHCALYTTGDSDSLPTDTAEALLQGLVYTLGKAGLDPADWPEADLEAALPLGRAALADKLSRCRSLYRQAAGSTVLESAYYRETLGCFRTYLKRYDCYFMAHRVPTGVDYLLCRPLPESLMGLDYAEAYLRALALENRILASLSREGAAAVAARLCPSYRESPLNLCEPAAVCAIGLMAAGGDWAALRATAADRDRLAALLEPLPESMGRTLLDRAAEQLGAAMHLREAGPYLQAIAADAYPRFRAASDAGGLEALLPDCGPLAMPGKIC